MKTGLSSWSVKPTADRLWRRGSCGRPGCRRCRCCGAGWSGGECSACRHAERGSRLATRAQPPFGRRGDRLGRRGRPFSRYRRRPAVYSAGTGARGTNPCRPADPEQRSRGAGRICRQASASLRASAYNPLRLPLIAVAAGDVLPAGTDAVVPLELAEPDQRACIEIVEAVAAGDNVEHQGAVATMWRDTGARRDAACRAPYRVADDCRPVPGPGRPATACADIGCRAGEGGQDGRTAMGR